MAQYENDQVPSSTGAQPGAAAPLAAPSVQLASSPVGAPDLVSGSPATGSCTVRTFGDVEVGIWEMTPGAVRDVEADEVFVVLSGAASVRFDDGREVSLRPGDVMSLFEGERTVWTVSETLRKVYVLRSDDATQT